MAGVTDAAWDGSASNYEDAASYCKACLIDENPAGQDKVKSACSLPVLTPDGTLNSNAVHAAASSLAGGRGGVKASPASKKAAAKKLVKLYGQLQEDAPPSIKQMAQ
jgi:hypothetical protein